MNFRKRFNASTEGLHLAPMVDVVFLLLCFFVAIQMYAEYEAEIDITVPTAETGLTPDRLPGEVILNINTNGIVVINGISHEQGALRTKLASLASLWPGQPVLIRADQATRYDDVISVVDLCRQCDIYRLSFAVGFEEEVDREE